MIKKLLFESRYFFLLFIFFWIVGFLFVLNSSKGDAVLFFNERRSTFLNLYFLMANLLAEWQFLLLILVLMIWKSFGLTFISIISFILSTIIVQFLKKIVFNCPRPATYFKEDVFLNFLEGMPIAYHHSFPSGHTTTAFLIFCTIAFFSKNKWIQFLLFFAAFSTGIARIYLLQHFAIDVLAGATLGVFISTLVYFFIIQTNLFEFEKWKDKSLFKYLNKNF